MSHENIATIAVHAGAVEPASVTRPKVAPIFASSVWTFDSLEQIDAIYQAEAPGFIYSRIANPGVAQLEEAVARLEGAAAAAAYASGMAAIAMAVLAEAGPGDHILAHQVLYGGTYALFKNELSRFGIEIAFADFTDLDAVRQAMRSNTRILYTEAICNPIMEVIDVPEIAGIAREKGAKLIVDSTFTTPYLLRPLALGADAVVHSATKYLNGHSDVTAGVVAGSAEFISRVKKIGTSFGPALSPFDAWLILRGIKTLHLRMRAHSDNALALARFLAQHPKVTAVNYPGLESSPSRAVAARILPHGCGGMLSFAVTGGLAGAKRLLGALKMAELVPSLAGPSTTTSHPGKTSHRAVPLAEREAYGVGDGLIRVSVGIEDVADIIRDFDAALREV